MYLNHVYPHCDQFGSVSIYMLVTPRSVGWGEERTSVISSAITLQKRGITYFHLSSTMVSLIISPFNALSSLWILGERYFAILM